MIQNHECGLTRKKFKTFNSFPRLYIDESSKAFIGNSIDFIDSILLLAITAIFFIYLLCARLSYLNYDLYNMTDLSDHGGNRRFTCTSVSLRRTAAGQRRGLTTVQLLYSIINVSTGRLYSARLGLQSSKLCPGRPYSSALNLY